MCSSIWCIIYWFDSQGEFSVKHRDNILRLHSEGKSYSEIVAQLGCSKGTIAYHCGKDQKKKHRLRLQQHRKVQHPFYRKIDNFTRIRRTTIPTAPQSSAYKLLYAKVLFFAGKGATMLDIRFTVQDVINQFGENPTCYLTGQQIDIWQPSTYEFDHMIPKSRGGTNDISNLGICTKQANQAKRNMTPDEFVNLCNLVVTHQRQET